MHVLRLILIHFAFFLLAGGIMSLSDLLKREIFRFREKRNSRHSPRHQATVSSAVSLYRSCSMPGRTILVSDFHQLDSMISTAGVPLNH